MIFKVAVLLLLTLVSVSCGSIWKTKVRSCKDVLTSGIYTIHTNVGPMQVYCEMEANGGGYTFLPKSAITTGSKLDLFDIYTDSSNVLLRFQTASNQQPFSVLEQLPKFEVLPLSVQINSFNGYTKPFNTAMGAYLYLGFIPRNIANQKTIQGLNSEGVDITFRNCDKNPNSYFALFPNPKSVAPNPYLAGATFSMHKQILQSALRVPMYRKMPAHFFFFTEMHFGGCGLYRSTNQWKEVKAMAIGLR